MCLQCVHARTLSSPATMIYRHDDSSNLKFAKRRANEFVHPKTERNCWLIVTCSCAALSLFLCVFRFLPPPCFYFLPPLFFLIGNIDIYVEYLYQLLFEWQQFIWTFMSAVKVMGNFPFVPIPAKWATDL